SSSPMAAAKPPRATVVVPLVARPLVTCMTVTPASAHSKAAIVPAAPPPMISTSVWWHIVGISKWPTLLGMVILSGSVALRLALFPRTHPHKHPRTPCRLGAAAALQPALSSGAISEYSRKSGSPRGASKGPCRCPEDRVHDASCVH